MNTDIQTTHSHTATQMLAKLQALKPLVTSLMLVLPMAFITFLMIETRTIWPHSQLFMVIILGLMAMDFLMLVLIEPYRQELGAMTIPSMLAFIGIAVMATLTEGLSRFFPDTGVDWLTPLAFLGLLVIYAGMFREKLLPMKIFLCVNALALTLLGCLGDTSKISLPF